MTIGFTSTTFAALEPEKICALGAEAGADCIEWSGRHITSPAQGKELAARCAALGIACRSVGSYYYVGEADPVRWEHICQIAAALDASFIRVWLGKKGSAKTSEQEYAALLADARQMLGIAAHYGLMISAEAHPNTYNDSCKSSLRFLRDIDRPKFTTYFQSLYRDMPMDLDRLAQTYPYVNAAHVSFSEVTRNRMLLPKEGGCVERVVAALRERQFKGPLLLEFVSRNNSKTFLRDMARLRQLANPQPAGTA